MTVVTVLIRDAKCSTQENLPLAWILTNHCVNLIIHGEGSQCTLNVGQTPRISDNVGSRGVAPAWTTGGVPLCANILHHGLNLLDALGFDN